MADGETEELRLFIACELSDEVRQELRAIQDDLRRSIGTRLRWARPEGVHLTLKFLGAVAASRVEAVTAALERAVEPFRAEVRLSKLGGFGGRRLRVVWAGLDGDIPVLASLAEGIDGAMASLGFPKERRPFAAHLTLARVPDEVGSRDRQAIGDVIERYRMRPQAPMILTQVALMRSLLGPGGSVYRRLAAVPGSA